ncbi:MAG: hypothetical protein KJ601_02595 [Nanoarchaeota archaeon]|nr:hypothetical protein [Nanoarchaeota archaeon]MBU1705100.1 hypothetical protein [Nanoarchaeota archaeon]
MRNIYTLEEPRELINDLHEQSRRIFQAVHSHDSASLAKEKVDWDKTISKYTELFEDEFLRYEFAFFRQMRRDAQRIAEIAAQNPEKAEEVEELIKKVEELFTEFRKSEMKLHFRIMFMSGFIRRCKAETLRAARKVKGFSKQWEARKKKREERESKAVETEQRRLEKKRKEQESIAKKKSKQNKV